MGSRIDITPYDGKGDFYVWCLKMKVVLSHHKVLIALEEDNEKWSEDALKRKADINQEAFNLIILSLSDSIICKVSRCKTPTELWKKLEAMYANLVAPNLSYLKASLFSYKMNPSKTIDDNLDDFLKMTMMLRDTEHALDDTSIVMILMNSIVDNYHVVKDAFQYTGTVPTFDQFCTALRTRELELKAQKLKAAARLFVKGKSRQGDSKKNAGSSSSKGNTESSKGTFEDKKDQKKKMESSWKLPSLW